MTGYGNADVDVLWRPDSHREKDKRRSDNPGYITAVLWNEIKSFQTKKKVSFDSFK